MNKTLDDIATTLENKVTQLENKVPTTKIIKRYSIGLPFGLIFGILWGMGVIVAKGFWATLAAFFIPFIGPAVSVMWLLEKFAGVS